MTTVREAFDAMGFALDDGETVCISFGEERFKEYSLATVGDRELGANVYFSTGTFPADTKWSKGARAFKNVVRILELPFDFDLKDFLNQAKDDIYELDDEELSGYMPLLQRAVEDIFARLSLPIHRLDCTGYGLSAHIVLPRHAPEGTAQIRQWHAAIVNRINAIFGDVLADAQVKDAGSRIMRLIPCANVGTREDGSRVAPRASYNIFQKPGYIDQARLETAAGAIEWKGSTVDIPFDGEILSAAQAQAIVDAYAPFHLQGHKHFMGLAVAGQLAKARVPEEQALAIVTAIAANDNKPWDRQKAVRDTYEKVRNGQEIAGYSVLRGLVDDDALSVVDNILRRTKITILDNSHAKPATLDDIKLFNPPMVPEAAFYGWHGEWLELVSPTTSSSPAFHLAASTTLQAAMMGRRISTMYAGDTIFPNQFAVVIGRTGNSYKDTAYRRTIQMLENWKKANLSSPSALTRDEFQVMRDFASREALVDTMISTPNVYLFSTEITSLFKNATRESTATLLDALINVWDSPPEITTNSMRARNDGKGAAQNPYMNIYGGTQPNRIGDYMTETMISSGLGNRIAIFMGQATGKLAQTPPLDFKTSVSLYQRLQDSIKSYNDGTVLIMSQHASDLWDDWFYSIPEEVEELANDMKVRHPMMVQKWALMFAVSDQAQMIERHHLEAALEIIEWMWECIQLYLPSWGTSSDRKIEERILTVLGQRQPMTKRDLNRYVRGKWTAREFATVFRAMKENQQIVVDTEEKYVALHDFPVEQRQGA